MRQHLQFVLNNFFIKPFENERNEIIYLICAFLNEEDEEGVEILKELKDDVTKLRHQQNTDLEEVLNEIRKVRTKIANLESA